MDPESFYTSMSLDDIRKITDALGLPVSDLAVYKHPRIDDFDPCEAFSWRMVIGDMRYGERYKVPYQILQTLYRAGLYNIPANSESGVVLPIFAARDVIFCALMDKRPENELYWELKHLLNRYPTAKTLRELLFLRLKAQIRWKLGAPGRFFGRIWHKIRARMGYDDPE